MKKLDRAAEAVLGVLRAEGDKLWLQGVDKKERREVPVTDAGGAAPGDLVLAALGANLLLMLAALLAAGPLMRIMGAKIEAVITRLLG
ncbi:hypothetical protein LTR94_037375, partial [Friedmanniomyces endolithicus]